MRGILSISFPPDGGESNIFPHCFVKANKKLVTRKNWTQMEYDIFFYSKIEKILLNLNPSIPSEKKKRKKKKRCRKWNPNINKSQWRKCYWVSSKAQDRTAKHIFRVGFTKPLLHSLLSKIGTIVQYKQHFFSSFWSGVCTNLAWFLVVFIIFVACSQLFLFLWCSILSIWNEIQMCSWNCIADGITGWSWFLKKI